MSGQFNSVSDYLRSLSEMADGNYTSFYRSLNGQLMFPDDSGEPADTVDSVRPQPGKSSRS